MNKFSKIVKNPPKPNDLNSLAKWNISEEKQEYSSDKEILIILIGIVGFLISIFVKTFVFAALIVIATAFYVYYGRQKPKRMLFDITDIGVFLENDFIELSEIKSFNIIDDPGDRATLILNIDKFVPVKEIIPIYDVDIDKIKEVLLSLEIKFDETLQPKFIDNIVSII